jgi:hypothetical protein
MNVQPSTGVRPESQSIMRPPLRWFSRDKDPRAYLSANSSLYQALVKLLQRMNFDSIKRDGDGVIGPKEASTVRVLSEAYDRVDTDNDGLISRKDYAAAQRCC